MNETEHRLKYPCPIAGCESRSGSPEYLDRHIKRVHGNDHLAMHKLFMALGEESDE